MKIVTAIGSTLLLCCSASCHKPATFVTGMSVLGGTDSCPIFVTDIRNGSPAAEVGILSGDLLTAVDGIKVADADSAAKLLHSETPKSVTITVLRDNKPHQATIRLERNAVLLRKQHEKVLDNGMIVPEDATEAEWNGKIRALTSDRYVSRLFPSHYPTNEDVYYAGFEVLTLKDPPQVVVLGIEDGPASRAGVHWGDVIRSVDGRDPRNKSLVELESLFSKSRSTPMTLKIERQGKTKTFSFQLAETGEILRDNGNRLMHGTLVPLGVSERYLECFR